ncbi:hypothetical protein [Duganella aceris]|jgi:hypothetical protein|uniref:Uncharacterized protein n=1 Tax=Duganella aceris TaxID=2703883 RepID=A0ABX0FQN0_9BURK|nr:hypothetical protein [Duganella aceris]NGZ86949.1 hypothetical protein [Duganella aceris]
MKRITQALGVALLALCAQAQAAALKQVYVDDGGKVHLVTSAGKELLVEQPARAANAKLAPDGETAAWLVMGAAPAQGESEPGASEVRLYRDGKSRAIKCEPFIRDFWFWKKGSRIVIDCGGSHFAGREVLYDAKSLKLLDSFNQDDVPVEKRPDWSSSSDRYKPD